MIGNFSATEKVIFVTWYKDFHADSGDLGGFRGRTDINKSLILTSQIHRTLISFIRSD